MRSTADSRTEDSSGSQQRWGGRASRSPVTTQSSPVVRPDSGRGDRAGPRESGERQLAGKIQLWVIFYFLSWKEAIWGFVCCQFVF